MKHYERVISICSFLFLFVNVGLASTSFGVYQPYLAASPGIGDGAASLIVSVRTFMALAAMFLVNHWYNRLDCRLGIAFACFFTGIGFVLYAFANTLVGLCFGAIFAGLGYGLGGFVGMTLLTGRWYKEHVGTAIGFASLGSGIAGMIMPTIIHAIIAGYNLNLAFLLEAMTAFIIGIVQLVLLRNRPTEMHTLIHHRSEQEKQHLSPLKLLHKKLIHHGKEIHTVGRHLENTQCAKATQDSEETHHSENAQLEQENSAEKVSGEASAKTLAQTSVQENADKKAVKDRGTKDVEAKLTQGALDNKDNKRGVPSGNKKRLQKCLPKKAQLLLLIACVFVGMVSVGGMAYVSILLTSSGFEEGFAAYMLSVIGIALAASKFGSGELFDHIGTFRGTACLFTILVISLILLILCCMPLTQSIVLAVIGSVGFGLGVAIGSVGVSVWSLELSDMASRAKMVKNLQVGYASGAFLAGTFPGFLAELCGSYIPTYVILTVTSTLAAVIVLFIYSKYRKNK